MRTTAIFNLKGGVAKAVTTINLAENLENCQKNDFFLTTICLTFKRVKRYSEI